MLLQAIVLAATPHQNLSVRLYVRKYLDFLVLVLSVQTLEKDARYSRIRPTFFVYSSFLVSVILDSGAEADAFIDRDIFLLFVSLLAKTHNL